VRWDELRVYFRRRSGKSVRYAALGGSGNQLFGPAADTRARVVLFALLLLPIET
jgi:hypothetical protein